MKPPVLRVFKSKIGSISQRSARPARNRPAFHPAIAIIWTIFFLYEQALHMHGKTQKPPLVLAESMERVKYRELISLDLPARRWSI
jgi:hypothetical protein